MRITDANHVLVIYTEKETKRLGDREMEETEQTERSFSKKRYHANTDYILRFIAGEGILIPAGASADQNSMLALNDTCCFLWNVFQTPHTIEEAAQEARREYLDPDGVIEKETAEFVSAYLQEGLLKEEKDEDMDQTTDGGTEVYSE